MGSVPPGACDYYALEEGAQRVLIGKRRGNGFCGGSPQSLCLPGLRKEKLDQVMSVGVGRKGAHSSLGQLVPGGLAGWHSL